MGRAEKHPIDEGKYQSTFSNYGHGLGNGKSRAAVYKHFKTLEKKEAVFVQSGEDLTKSVTQKQTKVEDESEDDYTKTDSFSDISWLSDEELDDMIPTIPKPIRALAAGDIAGMSAAQRATQTQLINWGFMGIDRGLTHWGRGVTGHEEWGINRHPADYEAMTGATQHLMDENGISINLNPTLVWATVMSAAYVPPVTYVARNSDKTKRKIVFQKMKSILFNPLQLFRRKKKEVVHVTNDDRSPLQA
tara:strand:- start:3960 stop:4700 length:741 start_codon:yes stop_codon:yes gene_type:complete